MYTTDIQNNGTVSAADGERLPPGGFSLRHGFPNWFSRGSQRATAAAAAASAAAEGSPHGDTATPQLTGHARLITPEQAPAGPAASYASTDAVHTSAYDVLKYVRSAFGDEDVLDSIPLEAAGNPGAWHAWRTHRRVQGKVFPEDQASTTGGGEEQQASAGQVPASSSTSQAPRQPGEWNWEGVWEDRVKKGINASLSEPVLYGGTAALPDDLVSGARASTITLIQNRQLTPSPDSLSTPRAGRSRCSQGEYPSDSGGNHSLTDQLPEGPFAAPSSPAEPASLGKFT